MTTFADQFLSINTLVTSNGVCNFKNSGGFVSGTEIITVNLANIKKGNNWSISTVTGIGSTTSLVGPLGTRVRVISIVVNDVGAVTTTTTIFVMGGIPTVIPELTGGNIAGNIYVVDTTPTSTYDIDLRVFAHKTLAP